jgi:hypothetical protein
MLAYDPSERATAEESLAQPFLFGVWQSETVADTSDVRSNEKSKDCFGSTGLFGGFWEQSQQNEMMSESKFQAVTQNVKHKKHKRINLFCSCSEKRNFETKPSTTNIKKLSLKCTILTS